MSINLEGFELSGRMRKYRVPIAVSHRLTLFLTTVASRAVPVIHIAGYPRSGTTWLCHLIADYFSLPHPQMWLLPLAGPAVTHTHIAIRPRKRRTVYILRDGRDCLLSMYFMALRSMSDRKPLLRTEYWIPAERRQNVHAELPGFIRHYFRRPSGSALNWARHVEYGLRNYVQPGSLVRYEDLLGTPHDTLSQTVSYLSGIPADEDRVHDVVNRNSFSRVTGRTRGTADNSMAARKGVAGDWRSYFSREAAEVFDAMAGEVLRSCDYECNPSWVETQPPLHDMDCVAATSPAR